MSPIIKTILACSLLSISVCHAESVVESNKTLTIGEAAKELKWELGGLTGGILYLGLKEWDWGSSSFKFNDEGWFGMNRGSGGADKLGHLYSTYLMDEFLTDRLYQKTGNLKDAALKGAIFSGGLMLLVETFDGVSSDHGFSYEDLMIGVMVFHILIAYINIGIGNFFKCFIGIGIAHYVLLNGSTVW